MKERLKSIYSGGVLFGFLTLFLIVSTSALASDVKEEICFENSEVKKCRINLLSDELSSEVSLRVIGPPDISWERLPLLVFLHGRSGNASAEKPIQFMASNFMEYIKTDEYKNSPFVVVAPQDNFIHDGKGGNDYWLGSIESRRNWPRFLAFEMISFLNEKYRVGMSPCKRIITGVSMGAHGALLTGMNYSNQFAGIGSHSPIFKAQMYDVKDFDKDVFGSEENEEVFNERSVGCRVLETKESFKIPVFIDIGETDPLLIKSYKSGLEVWDLLEEEKEFFLPSGSVIRRGVVPNGKSGHGFKYWRSMYETFYFNWYQSIFNKECELTNT